MMRFKVSLATGLLLFALCSCSGGTPEAAPPVASSPVEEPAPLPPTPTFTPTEVAFAANIDPLTGLPSEIEGIAERPLMAYAIDFERGGQAPAGIEAVELVVEHPPDPLDPRRLRLTALSRLRAGERPNLGPLGDATALDIDIARAFGADLTVLSLDPALNSDGIVVTRFSASATEGEAGEAELSESQRDEPALETASAAANQGQTSSPALVTPWIHEKADAAEEDSAARSLFLDTSVAPTFSGDAQVATRWELDTMFGTWLRLEEGEAGNEPVAVGDPSDATFLQTANILVLSVSDLQSQRRWTGQGSGLGLAGERPLGELAWSRDPANSSLSLRGDDNLPPLLNPGSVWIVLWPESVDISIE